MFARLMGLKTISPSRLHQRIQERERVIVLDVNSPQSWMTARVPGARNVDPAGNLENALPREKNALLVFYCSNPLCRKAPIAARRATALGYTNVRVMSAGIKGWLAAKLPVDHGTESAEPNPAPDSFSIRIAEPRDVRDAHRVRLSVGENRLTRTVITEADYIDAITRTGRGWVAEIDGVIRGFAVGDRENGSVWALFVEPAYEGCGIGRALHDVMMTWMRSTGCVSATLVTEHGTRAERFYRKAGWQYAGKTAEGDAHFEMDMRAASQGPSGSTPFRGKTV